MNSFFYLFEKLKFIEAYIIPLAIILLVSLSSYFIIKKYVVRILYNMIGKVKPRWKTILIKFDTLNQLAYLTPVVILYFFSQNIATLANLLTAAIIINSIVLSGNLLSASSKIYSLYPISKIRPIKSYIQLLTVFIYIIGIITSICVSLGMKPWAFLSGITALTAIIVLVFRDTILSFIAGIQIVANNLIRTGDWIEVPQYGADGDVIDVALHVVKVQNWDKTIVTIPIYKLIESGFKNWRGMFDSGGRRIKRSIFLDQTSIQLVSEELIQYLLGKKIINSAIVKDDMTNLGIFRNYVKSYLDNHPEVKKDMTLMVRLLDPTPSGIPMEIYTFIKDTRWLFYENIQSGIFEHLLAILPEFNLRVFQNPTGFDCFSAIQRYKNLK